MSDPFYPIGSNFQSNIAPPALRKHPKVKGWILPQRNIEDLPLTRIRAVVDKLSECFAVPQDMALMEVISGANIPVQAIADVETLGGRVSPTSLYFLLLAPSGAGKTPLQRTIFQGINENEDELLAQKLGDAFDPNDVKRPLIIADDATPPAMVENLKKVECAALVSTEASQNFDKWGMQSITAINQVYDGDDIRISRAGSNGYTLKLSGGRLSISWVLQTDIFLGLLKTKDGKYWADVGAFNRFMMCVADIDFSNIPKNDADSLDQVLLPYRDRQRELMFQAYTPGYQRKVVRCDPAAKKLYEKILIDLRSECKEGGYFYAVPGYAQKLQDIVLRVAATFHVFEGFEGDISENTLRHAYQVVLHYADYHVALFTPIEQCVLDAMEIHEIIQREFRVHGTTYISPEARYFYLDAIKSRLPSELRKTDRLHDALRVLCQNNLIAVYWGRQGNERTRKMWVDIYPTLNTWIPPWLTLEERAL